MAAARSTGSSRPRSPDSDGDSPPRLDGSAPAANARRAAQDDEQGLRPPRRPPALVGTGPGHEAEARKLAREVSHLTAQLRLERDAHAELTREYEGLHHRYAEATSELAQVRVER